MCLRLFRNFVRLRLGKKKEEHLSPLIDPGPPIDSSRVKKYTAHARQKELDTVSWDELPFVDEELAPPPEVTEVDPSKAYFSALPHELKMEIVDHIWVDWTIPLGRNALPETNRKMTGSREALRALKSLRRCSRDCALLGVHTLFATINLTPRYRRKERWLKEFEAMVPFLGHYIRNVSIFIDKETDHFIRRVFPQLPNIQWLLIDTKHFADTEEVFDPTEIINTLTQLPRVTRISTFHTGGQSSVDSVVNLAMLAAHGRRLRTFDLYVDWRWGLQSNHILEALCRHATSLSNLYVYSTRGSMLERVLVGGEFVWPSRNTLREVHFEECTEVEAPVVTEMVRTYHQLTNVTISSCGGPGDYGNAAGRDKERDLIMTNLKPLARNPLRSLRIVHATDIEFRHMSPIPTDKLIIYDPLDQLLLPELLRNPTCFPGLRTLELQYILEPGGDDTAIPTIQHTIEKRGCTFIDSRHLHTPPFSFWSPL